VIKERTFVSDVVADLRPVLRRHVGADIEVFANRRGEVAAEVKVERIGWEFVLSLYVPNVKVYVNEDMEVISGPYHGWAEVHKHICGTYDAKAAYLEGADD
jgi:hypothetical protein